ncbi:hypothetical protein OH76DRAFT_932893 [Lentinus brumalis]|uniref:Uncharacterized protein n=1 Tax=Lentinus brumalis TaxID=2498619 RepID=A0A371CZQ9_9APHY|nr:hypothetical protein OH76DRAFT_932893 [Polyporus brumalis]
MVSLKKASVFSTFVEAMFYGFSVLMLILTLWILLGHRQRRRPNYSMLAASCVLFILATAEMAVNITRLYQAFVTVGPHVHGGPEAYFEDLSHVTFIAKSFLYCTQTLIIDGVVIYRAHVVWKNTLIVVLPMLAWCGLVVAAIGTNITLIKQAGLPFDSQVVPWITALYALDLSTNFLSTALLASRLWNVVRRTSRFRSGTGLAPVLRVIIESGAIYSATVGAGMILFLVHSNAVFILMDMTSPIISIVFNMIVVRVGLARERRSNRCSNRAPQICSDFVAVGLTPRNASQNWRDPGESPSAEDAGVELDDFSTSKRDRPRTRWTDVLLIRT